MCRAWRGRVGGWGWHTLGCSVGGREGFEPLITRGWCEPPGDPERCTRHPPHGLTLSWEMQSNYSSSPWDALRGRRGEGARCGERDGVKCAWRYRRGERNAGVRAAGVCEKRSPTCSIKAAEHREVEWGSSLVVRGCFYTPIGATRNSAGSFARPGQRSQHPRASEPALPSPARGERHR